MVSQGDSAIKRPLQKAFKQINQTVETWAKQRVESTRIILSVTNLIEQFGCCQVVKFESTPLKSFKDLKQKLLIKLSAEIDNKMYQLRAILFEQETLCKKISKQRHLVCGLYDKYSVQLDFNTSLGRTVTQHSVAEMMEWLIDIDNQLYQQYCCKQYLLDSLQYDDPKGIEILDRSWTKTDQVVTDQINKTLDPLCLFVKEDF